MTDEAQDLARLLELLWAPSSVGGVSPRRGPVPSLSREVLAQECVQVADAHGLAAVSMQRVAEGLGVTKMALYRYVRSKAELLALTVEEAIDAPPTLRGRTWRRAVEQWAEALRAVWRRHPWLPAATVGHRLMGPREVGWIDVAVEAFEGSGLDGVQRRDAVLALCALVRATVHDRAAGTQPWTTGGAPGAAMAALLAEHADRYPALAAAPLAAGSEPVDRTWRFSLTTFLDGVEHRNMRSRPPGQGVRSSGSDGPGRR